MSEPWYSPEQLMVSLGITLPLFLFYGFRIYNSWLEQRASLKFFLNADKVEEFVAQHLTLPSQIHLTRTVLDLRLSSIWSAFDEDLLSLRRSMRGDVYSIILIGFIGTLVGISSAFSSILYDFSSQGVGGPGEAIKRLLGSGIATALVSSLVAAALGVAAMSFLTFTEKRVSQARTLLMKKCAEVCASLHRE